MHKGCDAEARRRAFGGLHLPHSGLGGGTVMTPQPDGGVVAKTNDGGVAAPAAAGVVAATAATGSSCLRAAVVEHVVDGMRTPTRDATCTTRFRGLLRQRGEASQLELSSGGVAGRRQTAGAIGDWGRSKLDKLWGGGMKAMWCRRP